MATGVYGTVRPSDVDLNDIDIFYNFIPDRGVENNLIYRLDPDEVLSEVFIDDDEELSLENGENILEGLFNLKLPATIFNEVGVYTIYIKPKAYLTQITDCNVLSSLPSVKGIVLDLNSFDDFVRDKLQTNNALQGYRVEYYDDNNRKIRNLCRYVVTSNKVVPVNENIGNTDQSTTRYRFDESGQLLFLQLTPSTAPNVRPNQTPFIGKPGQTIKISNTFFTPLVIEVDMVEHTIESLTNILIGEQVKDVKNGILTYYDKNREIIKQFNLFQIKETVDDVPLYEVKEKRVNIDTTQNFDDIISEI